MIKSNGGVFGRHPDFGTVTTQGSLSVGTTATVAGNVTLTNGNVVVASGKGIDFSATASGTGTMISELLADYEEGTWTPTYDTLFGTSITVTYTTQIGYYVKVGNLVWASFQVSTASVDVTGAVNRIVVRGLPFTAASASYYGSGMLSGDNREWTTIPTSCDTIFTSVSLWHSNGVLILPGDMNTVAGANKNRINGAVVYSV